MVERQTESRPFSVAEPADPRRKSLEVNPLAGEVDPAPKSLVLGEELKDQPVGARDICRVPRERHPTKRSLAPAEERPDICGDKPGKAEGAAESCVQRLLPDVVPVIKRDRTFVL